MMTTPQTLRPDEGRMALTLRLQCDAESVLKLIRPQNCSLGDGRRSSQLLARVTVTKGIPVESHLQRTLK